MGHKGKCPICGKPAIVEYRPFCSRRCSDLDLQKWLSNSYAVPGEPVSPEALPPEDGE